MMYGSPASSAAPQPSPTDGNKNLWGPPFPALFFEHQRLFHKYYDVWATELMKRRTQYGQNLRKTVGSTRVQDHQEGPSILPCQPEPCLLLLVMIFFKSGIPPQLKLWSQGGYGFLEMTTVGNTSEIHAVVPVVKARRSQRQTVIFRSDQVDSDHRLVIKVECPLSVISGSLTGSASKAPGRLSEARFRDGVELFRIGHSMPKPGIQSHKQDLSRSPC